MCGRVDIHDLEPVKEDVRKYYESLRDTSVFKVSRRIGGWKVARERYRRPIGVSRRIGGWKISTPHVSGLMVESNKQTYKSEDLSLWKPCCLFAKDQLPEAP